MTSKLLPFGWYGGKFAHLGWLLPLLPACDTFVDVFGGSGSVLLNRSPSPLEVFNDIDKDLITFFRVLRDDPGPLLEALRLTPWSREEHRIACEKPATTDHERARRFFIRCAQSIGGQGHLRRPSSWSYSVRSEGIITGNVVGKTKAWQRRPDKLVMVSQRLLNVQVECLPAVELVSRYDHDDTLFYCDPPYPHALRGDVHCYGENEMTDDDHEDLAKALRAIKGKAAVSGYRCSLYDRLYDGWHRTDGAAQVPTSARHGVHRKVTRQESLWTNYAPAEATGQATLFAS